MAAHGSDYSRRLKDKAGSRPVVVVPTFYDNYVRYRMSRRYWDRFRELGQIPGIYVIDLLPHLQKLGADAIRCFQAPHDMHFSAHGHLVIADVLEMELGRLKLLPSKVSKVGQHNTRSLDLR